MEALELHKFDAKVLERLRQHLNSDMEEDLGDTKGHQPSDKAVGASHTTPCAADAALCTLAQGVVQSLWREGWVLLEGKKMRIRYITG